MFNYSTTNKITALAAAATWVGPRIRAWRQTRGLSQFELASRAGFSVRHISFIETGRAQPSREAVLAIGEVLELPLRERNRLLESAGFAPPEVQDGWRNNIRLVFRLVSNASDADLIERIRNLTAMALISPTINVPVPQSFTDTIQLKVDR